MRGLDAAELVMLLLVVLLLVVLTLVMLSLVKLVLAVLVLVMLKLVRLTLGVLPCLAVRMVQLIGWSRNSCHGPVGKCIYSHATLFRICMSNLEREKTQQVRPGTQRMYRIHACMHLCSGVQVEAACCMQRTSRLWPVGHQVNDSQPALRLGQFMGMNRACMLALHGSLTMPMRPLCGPPEQ